MLGILVVADMMQLGNCRPGRLHFFILGCLHLTANHLIRKLFTGDIFDIHCLYRLPCTKNRHTV